ncbi:MAG: ABC transporter ATP-binding protein [Thaumarchaeota archaeon]|mgnify:CR=1 FL=1|nr:MAG: ABC transporter ATP-binding protein [Nitrososphaerota archaeon]
MSTAIKIDDLWVRYRGEEDYVIKGLSLEIEEGEFVLLMGASGCGKTTLCLTIMGIIPRVIKAEVKGNVRVFDLNPLNASPAEIAKYVTIVFQNPEMQLVTTSVYEEIAFPLENFGLPQDEIERRVEEVLEVVGLKGLEDRSPASLSGGQKQALAIASVLALRPKIIILDEPTSQLDPQGTKRVTDLILKLRREFETTILAVEHRVEWAVEHVDRIVVMNDGKIILEGDPKTVFSKEIKPEETGFRPPQVSEIAYNLIRSGVTFPTIPISLNEALDIFRGILDERKTYS